MIASDNDQLRTPLDPPHVAVCIATYRRPLGLRRLLASLAALEFTQIPAVKLTLVIVDNDASTPPDPTLQIELASGPYPVIYVVEPSRGLAAVRNACLDHVPADADFVACVDDDEWVVPQWLEALLAVQGRLGADIVQGPVRPVYESTPSAWMCDGGYHEVGPFTDGEALTHGASGNVLITSASLRRTGARFDATFDRSGGEDVDFFHQMLRQGARMVAASDAIAYEAVPSERMALTWVLKRRFRTGHTLGQIGRRQGGFAVRVVKSLARLTVGIGQALTGAILSKTMAIKGLSNIAWGIGTLAVVVHVDIDHYSKR